MEALESRIIMLRKMETLNVVIVIFAIYEIVDLVFFFILGAIEETADTIGLFAEKVAIL